MDKDTEARRAESAKTEEERNRVTAAAFDAQNNYISNLISINTASIVKNSDDNTGKICSAIWPHQKTI